MEQAEDIGFTFDPHPFLNGLKAVNKGLDNLGDRTVSATKSMGKAFTGALLKVEGIKLAIKGAFSVMKQYMPEIGRSFDIAKDVFLKNLLWPLRQAVAPFLQKMLDWVRDNRAAFVKWGQVLANVFKVVIQFAKTLWGAVKQVFDIVKSLTGSLFKGGLAEGINVILTKVAVLVSWIGMGVERVLNWIGSMAAPLAPIVEGFKVIGEAIMQFASGAFNSFMQVLEGQGFKDAVTAMAKAFKDLCEALFGGDRGKMWGKLGEVLGYLAGTAFKLAIDALTVAFTVIAKVIDGLMAAVKWLQDFFSNDPYKVGKALGLSDADAKQYAKMATVQQAVTTPGSAENKALVAKAAEIPGGTAGLQRAGILPSGAPSGGAGDNYRSMMGLVSGASVTINVTAPPGADPRAYGAALGAGAAQSLDKAAQDAVNRALAAGGKTP